MEDMFHFPVEFRIVEGDKSIGIEFSPASLCDRFPVEFRIVLYLVQKTLRRTFKLTDLRRSQLKNLDCWEIVCLSLNVPKRRRQILLTLPFHHLAHLSPKFFAFVVVQGLFFHLDWSNMYGRIGVIEATSVLFFPTVLYIEQYHHEKPEEFGAQEYS
nr:hypothetical transcript [Hymenolepis microstoma]